MIQSMTGFGKNSIQVEGKSVNIEIRTLNSKQLDLTVRMAPLFREMENEVRNCVAQKLLRGKIELSIYIEKTEKPQVSIDKELATAYYHQLVDLSQELDNPVQSDIFCQLLRLPDVVTSSREELTEELKASVMAALEKTCDKVVAYRLEEGSHLAADFAKRIKMIDDIRTSRAIR